MSTDKSQKQQECDAFAKTWSDLSLVADCAKLAMDQMMVLNHPEKHDAAALATARQRLAEYAGLLHEAAPRAESGIAEFLGLIDRTLDE
jgi:hypothetical protein